MEEKDHISSLITAYLTNEIGPEEEVELMAWRKGSLANEKLFKEYASVWKKCEQIQLPNFDQDKNEIWQQVSGKTNHFKIQGNNFRLYLRMAAGLAILVGAIFVMINLIEKDTNENVWVKESALASTKIVLMPDSSTVQLNQGTQLAYLQQFEERKVKLTGEAFFNVRKKNGKRFEILAHNARIIVLGTAFNVRALPEEDHVEVTVLSGHVSLSPMDQEAEIILEKGETAILNRTNNSLIKLDKGKTNAVSWKNNRLVFKDESMESVLAALEDHFNQKIITENEKILNCNFTGTFIEPDFNEVIKIIAYAIGLEVHKENGVLSLQGKGCPN